MTKPALTDHPIHPLLQSRWSPRAFDPTPPTEAQLFSLLEAARWAPSGGNVQPWSFVIARRQDAENFERLAACLNEGNRIWAGQAPVLILTVAQLMRAPGKPNPTALYDLGMAVAQLTVQATELGLYLHQMGGFSVDQARASFAIPEDYAPVTVIAVGALGNPESLPEPLQAREAAPRERKPLASFVYGESWGQPWAPLTQPE